MDVVYKIATWVVFIEFGLIGIIILTTFLLKILVNFKNRYDQQLAIAVMNYFKKINFDIHHFDAKKFDIKWRKLDILLPIIKELELQLDENWENLRILFFQTILLPLARLDAMKRSWSSRYYAVKAFSFFFEEQDGNYILKLINDKIAIIRYNAIIPAILYGSEKTINTIVTQMAAEPWLTQFIYLREFYNASGTSRIYIENFLKNSDDSKIRYVCYKLLMNYPPLKFSWDYKQDFQSDYIRLKIAALLYITYVNRELAIQIITSSLTSQEWQVKAIAIICLKKLKLQKSIAEIADYLNDANQRVALVAMQSLYELGEQGKKELSSRNITYNPVALDITNDILKI